MPGIMKAPERLRAPVLDLPFPQRLLVLASALVLVSLIELAIRGRSAVRWRYSIFVALSGTLGATHGAAHDAVTSMISPEYFAVLKGLGWDDLRVKAIILGAQAGCSFGVIVAALVAYLNERLRRPHESVVLRPLLGAWPYIAATSILAAMTTGTVAFAYKSGEPNARLLTAWLAHIGSYVGGAAGLVLWLRAHRKTRSLVPPQTVERATMGRPPIDNVSK